VGLVAVLAERFEAPEVTPTAFGLSVGELGDAVLDVGAGFDFDVGGVAVRRVEEEVRPAVVRQRRFAFPAGVPGERGDGIAG
jgi:hypothetical protein